MEKGRFLKYTEKQLEKMSRCSCEFTSGTIGIYNPLTGEKKRIKNNLEIPFNFKRGFGSNKNQKESIDGQS